MPKRAYESGDELIEEVDEESSEEEEQMRVTSSPRDLVPGQNISLCASGRIFLCSELERASGGFRPSFLISGHLMDIVHDDEQCPGRVHEHRMLQCLRWPPVHSSQHIQSACLPTTAHICILHPAGSHRLVQLPSTKGSGGFQLSLRYEPPSPKFSRSCPGMTSYRLKLLQGAGEDATFIYLLRGLPKELFVDHQALAVGWGQLQVRCALCIARTSTHPLSLSACMHA